MISKTVHGIILETNECIICMQEGDSSSALMCNRCKNKPIIHPNCMEEYINKNINECPLCRYPNYPTENINNIQVIVEQVNIDEYNVCGQSTSRNYAIFCNLTIGIAFVIVFTQFVGL